MGRETILTTAKWNEGEFPTFTPVRGVESGPLPSINKDISGDGYVSLSEYRHSTTQQLVQVLGQVHDHHMRQFTRIQRGFGVGKEAW